MKGFDLVELNELLEILCAAFWILTIFGIVFGILTHILDQYSFDEKISGALLGVGIFSALCALIFTGNWIAFNYFGAKAPSTIEYFQNIWGVLPYAFLIVGLANLFCFVLNRKIDGDYVDLVRGGFGGALVEVSVLLILSISINACII